MKTYHVGIIGFGGFGQFLYNCWSEMPGVHLAAVAEEDSRKTQHLPSEIVYNDWSDLLQIELLDVIAIVTPPATHRRIAISCMEAGKHVLIEKPLATTMADAGEIISVRDVTGAVAAVDLIMRFNPLINAIRSLASEGAFGRLRRVDVENYAQDAQLPPEHWFWDREISGGILVEHGVHFIDLMHYIWPAKVLEINGLYHARNPHQQDQVLANIVYEGGLIATHYHAFSRPGFFESTRIRLCWDLADIDLYGWIPLRADVRALVNPETLDRLVEHPLFSMTEQTNIDEATDESRPRGWEKPGNQETQVLSSGGIEYNADQLITGVFDIGKSKAVAYSDCVRASLRDALNKVDDPSHVLTAPLEPALKCLEIALRARDGKPPA